METADLYWLAGLAEGEGSFTISGRSAVFKIHMTDRDVVERAADIIERAYPPVRRVGRGGGSEKPCRALPHRGPVHEELVRQGVHKPVWYVKVQGRRARLLMKDLYHAMGERRRARIVEVLATTLGD